MKYAAQGVRTTLVTGTRGERGKAGDPPLCAPDEIGAWRERELREAVKIVGFDAFHLLDYRDRELADAPPDDMRRMLVGIIRRVRPSVVLTFDPNGFNLHADHVAISRFSSDAIASAADPRWFPESGASHTVGRLLWTPLYPPWDVAAFDSLSNKPSADFAIDVSPWRDRRIAALRAHRSQHLSTDKYFFTQPNLDRILATEVWRQAWGPPLAHRPEDDVMAGL